MKSTVLGFYIFSCLAPHCLVVILHALLPSLHTTIVYLLYYDLSSKVARVVSAQAPYIIIWRIESSSAWAPFIISLEPQVARASCIIIWRLEAQVARASYIII
jgi:hypothetical protein